mmetsp:Transcript_95498/g.270083  ORF Transcript_95498/g.270083 Transcript_95498/m.270083 type:complete len:317 (+) Transcript_95498:125-1075(+)
MAEDVCQGQRLAELERALCKEIGKRGELEIWLTRHIESKVKGAITSSTGILEDKLQGLFQHMVSETRERFGVLENDVGRIMRRIQGLEAKPGVGRFPMACTSEHAQAAKALFEDRISKLEHHVSRPLEFLPGNSAHRIQKIVEPFVQDAVTKCQATAERAIGDTNAVRERIVQLERWISQVVTPELVRFGMIACQRDNIDSTGQGVGRVPIEHLHVEGDECVTLQERKALMCIIFDLIDADRSGHVDGKDFVDLFAAKLPISRPEFNEVSEFLIVSTRHHISGNRRTQHRLTEAGSALLSVNTLPDGRGDPDPYMF